MRRTRIVSIIFFLLAAGAFAAFHFYHTAAKDTTAPVITMDSDTIQVSVEDDESAWLEGVTAEDKIDGDVSDSLFVETISNFLDDRTRTITLVAVDKSGNVSKASREVEYTDYTSPKFSLSAPLHFAIKTTDITTYLGAEDVFDGNLSSSVKVTGKYTLSSDAGDYPMEFSVTNSAGDVVKLDATVTLYNPADVNKYPQIGLKEYLVYTKVGQKLTPRQYLDTITYRYNEYQYESDGAFHLVPESEDGDTISGSSVKITDDVDYKTPGTYEIIYEYSADDYTGTVRLIVVVEE